MRFHRKKFLWVFILLCAGFLFGQTAWAVSIIPDNLIIDFRDEAVWGGADGQESFSPDNIVTATALPFGKTLFWDDAEKKEDRDGLGIRPGEPDEINQGEILLIEIAGGMNLTGVWITDLFPFPDGSDPDGEMGQVIINNDFLNPFGFSGSESNTFNGEQFVSFRGVLEVDSAIFSISGPSGNNEFSVAGFAPVPEPGTIVLLALGMLGVSIFGRKKGWLKL
jgi:hypothetical protein